MKQQSFLQLCLERSLCTCYEYWHGNSWNFDQKHTPQKTLLLQTFEFSLNLCVSLSLRDIYVYINQISCRVKVKKKLKVHGLQYCTLGRYYLHTCVNELIKASLKNLTLDHHRSTSSTLLFTMQSANTTCLSAHNLYLGTLKPGDICDQWSMTHIPFWLLSHYDG